MKRCIAWAALVLGTGLAGGCSQTSAPLTAQSPTISKLAEAGLEYSLPPGWKQQQENRLANSEESVVIQFIQPRPSESGVEGLKLAADRLRSRFSNLRFEGEPVGRQSNGLHLLSMRGSAMISDTPSQWELLMLEGGSHPLLLMEVASGADGLTQHRGELEQLASSFKVAPTSKSPEAPETTGTKANQEAGNQHDPE